MLAKSFYVLCYSKIRSIDAANMARPLPFRQCCDCQTEIGRVIDTVFLPSLRYSNDAACKRRRVQLIVNCIDGQLKPFWRTTSYTVTQRHACHPRDSVTSTRHPRPSVSRTRPTATPSLPQDKKWVQQGQFPRQSNQRPQKHHPLAFRAVDAAPLGWMCLPTSSLSSPRPPADLCLALQTLHQGPRPRAQACQAQLQSKHLAHPNRRCRQQRRRPILPWQGLLSPLPIAPFFIHPCHCSVWPTSTKPVAKSKDPRFV